MYRRYSLDRLDLRDHQLLHHQIHTISEFEPDSVIHNRQPHLSSRPCASLAQLVLKTGGVCALQQSWTEFGLNTRAGRNDGMADFIGRNLRIDLVAIHQ
jgi:hypothetical protein